MQSKATTVEQYLSELPGDRREAIEAVRKVIRKNLPKGYEEGMQYGMVGYYVPHSVYPPGYHCDPKQPLPFAGVASQKNHISLYLMCIYADTDQKDWFQKAWKATGRKLDMGKACIRFKSIDDVPLEVLGEAVRRVPVKNYIEYYESAIKNMGSKRKPASGKAKTAKKAAGTTGTKKAKKSAGSKTKKKTAKATAKKTRTSKKKVAKAKSAKARSRTTTAKTR